MEVPFRSVFLLTWLILVLYLVPVTVSGNQSGSSENNHETHIIEDLSDRNTEINKLNRTFQDLLEKGDLEGSRLLTEELLKRINNPSIDKNYLSDSYYFIGVYYFFVKKTSEAIRYFKLSISLREEIGLYDHHYSKALYNLGVISNMLGDFKSHEDFSVRSIDVEKKIFGENSPLLLSSYLSLITAYMDLQEYGKSLNYANIALNIANTNIQDVDLIELELLYSNIGVLYMLLADYSKAKIYLDKAESIFSMHRFDVNENYINLMNSLAITNGELGLTDKSREFYEKGISLAKSVNSSFTDNILNSYSISLGNSGKKAKGELLLKEALVQSRKNHGENSRNYFLLLNKYADYLREFRMDNNKAVECYEQCINYLSLNPQDLILKNLVYPGYSLSLTESGQSWKALEIIQSLLFQKGRNEKTPIFDNPLESLIKPDKKSLKILKIKYKILWDIHKQSSSPESLEAASLTAELIVSMLEKVRINISEEESRLFLGDKYRESYINAIRDFNLLYQNTGELKFLEKAFEYSEKSKVAGLLASTRELKAVQFHIPSVVADLEKELQRNISLYNARIGEESFKDYPDLGLLNNWKENLIRTTMMRDSLIMVFEKQYPDYYAIKYNTQMVDINSISKVIGHNSNYLNYILADSLLYVFVANRKYRQILAIQVDTSFYMNITKFRNLLSYPSPSENARLTFQEFKSTGNSLYQKLIMPVIPYLISDKLLISPDNILSFIPFETIPISAESGEGIM